MRDLIEARDERMELATLCCLLTERAAFAALSDCGLTRDHFGLERNKHVFDAVRDCYEQGLYAGGVLCVLLLERQLREAGKLADVGGEAGLYEIYEAVPSPAAVAHYVRALDAKLDVRRFGSGLERAADVARSGDTDEGRRILAKAAATPKGREMLKSQHEQVEALAQVLVDETRDGGGSATPTGFSKLDAILGGGFVPGRSYVVGGLTSAGKTALVLQFVLEVAKAGRGIAYVWSKEMHHIDCQRRMAAMTAEVPLPTGALKRLSDEAQERVDGSLKMLRDLPIVIDDRATTLPQMIEHARALRGKVALFVIDHARLVRVPGAKSEYESISEVSRAAKSTFAVECEAACLLLSQFSREAARDKDPKPHQLRGSGALEEDTNVGMTLTRAAYMKRDISDPTALLQVWKNRDGKVGRVPLEWDRRLARFIEPMQSEMRGGDDE